jgi:Kef-type K+ transport system membrane component KefB
LEEIEKLSQLGVLFLLFEMGLELSFDRLKVRLPAGTTNIPHSVWILIAM